MALKAPSSQGGRFSMRVFLSCLFIFLGIITFVQAFTPGAFRDIQVINDALKYITALGSIVGGIYMLFSKKSNSSGLKL